MFASNFTVDDKYLKHLRGQENLKTFEQSKTIYREGVSWLITSVTPVVRSCIVSARAFPAWASCVLAPSTISVFMRPSWSRRRSGLLVGGTTGCTVWMGLRSFDTLPEVWGVRIELSVCYGVWLRQLSVKIGCSPPHFHPDCFKVWLCYQALRMSCIRRHTPLVACQL